MEMLNRGRLVDIGEHELIEVNGGAVGGFIIGFMVGTTAAYIVAPIMAACGGTQEECEKVFLSCITIGAAVGSVMTGPI